MVLKKTVGALTLVVTAGWTKEPMGAGWLQELSPIMAAPAPSGVTIIALLTNSRRSWAEKSKGPVLHCLRVCVSFLLPSTKKRRVLKV